MESVTIVNSLDLQGLPWTPIAGYEKSRLSDYTEIRNEIEGEYCFSEGTTNLKVVRRIGSNSVHAAVYALRTPEGREIAGKIMPIINDKSKDVNKNEIEIATRASNLVLYGRTPYFPIVYGAAYCNDTRYDNANRFILPSKDWQVCRAILDTQDNPRRRRIMWGKYKQETHSMDLDDKVAYARRYGVDIDINTLAIPSDVLISELAWGDLSAFLEEGQTEQMLEDIYTTILLIIKDMQSLLHVVHNDFHPGNVLVSFEGDDGLHLLAHDFGESQIVETFTNADRLTDIEMMTSKLLDKFFPDDPFMTPRLGKMIDRIESLREINVDDPIELLLEYWKTLCRMRLPLDTVVNEPKRQRIMRK
jgi:hypothetical protein